MTGAISVRIAQRTARVQETQRLLSRLLTALLFLAAVGVLAFALPGLVFLAAKHDGPRRKNSALKLLHLGCNGVGWLWVELWRSRYAPHGPWHACQQCGLPITNRSRARFCSTLCRRLARLHTRLETGDDRAIARLNWLARQDKHDPTWGEVPF
jgi:hypothetical protein